MERREVPDFRRNWTIIVVRGSLDEATVNGIEREIQQLEGAGARLIVEVSELHYLHDYGVDVLVLLAHHMRAKGGLMALVDGRGVVRRALGDTELHELLPVFTTVRAAIAGMADDDVD